MSITAWPFSAATDFIAQLPELLPAPILLDVRMPDIDGLQMLTILKERRVNWPVIVMTAHGDITVAVRAMKLGAIEFLEKPFDQDGLNDVLARAFGISDDNATSNRERDDARRRIGNLTPRESEVINILAKGFPNKEASYRLGLSIRTVEMHRLNALLKLGVKSIAEVVVLITTADLVQSPPNSTLDRF